MPGTASPSRAGYRSAPNRAVVRPFDGYIEENELHSDYEYFHAGLKLGYMQEEYDSEYSGMSRDT